LAIWRNKSQEFGIENPYADIYRTKDNKGSNTAIVEMCLLKWISKHFTFRTSFGGTVDNNYYYNFNYIG
jgi:hypothetical protein